MERRILGLTIAALLALAPIAAQQQEPAKDQKKGDEPKDAENDPRPRRIPCHKG